MFRSQGDSDEEGLYRAHFLRADARRTVLAVVAAIVAALAFVPSDIRSVGGSRDLAILLAVRGASVLVDVAVLVVLLRSRSARHHDRAVELLLASFVLVDTCVVSTRPPEHVGHGIATLLAVTATYFVVRGPLRTRVIASGLLSLSTFWFALGAEVPVSGLTSVAVAHALIHVIGIVVVARVETSRREGFFSQLEGQRARAELAAKAADLEVTPGARAGGPPAAPAAAEVPLETVLSKAAIDALRQLETPEVPGFFAETCEHFIVDAEERLRAFERAVSANDPNSAERAVHSLKSMSAMLGAMRLSEMCRDLEIAARRGELPADPAVVARVRASLESASRALATEAQIEMPRSPEKV